VTTAVIYQSPFYNLSGYAAESRGLVRELVRQGITVRIHPVDPPSAAGLDPVEYAHLQRLADTEVDPAHSLLINAEPLMWSNRPQAPLAVIRTMFETDRILPAWVKNCSYYDEVWVPSIHNQEAFVRSGVSPERVKIVPGAIDTNLFRPGVDPLPLQRRKDFAFLSVFDWSWRKGWDLLITAYVREFRPEEPVTLYLKVNQLSGRQAIVSEVEYLIRAALGRAPGSIPDIVLMGFPIPDTDMPRLYAAVDAFVLPSRGEGYGRPYLEAMACGLPVIGTDWGGQTDFLTPEVAYPLRIKGLEWVPEFESRSIYRGLKWAVPDVAELRRLLRYVYTNRTEAKRKGEAARAAVAKGWNYGVVGERMAGEIERILSKGGLPHGDLGAT
jgi:glycosyltransferase involved in cell wall biosynthesis